MGIWRNIAAVFSGEPESTNFSSEESNQIPMLRAFALLNGPGLDGPISRDLAMQVPAVQSGRNLICGVSTLPLIQRNALMQTVEHPFLSQIERHRPNLVVLAETIEDLMMEKYAYWRVTERTYDNYPFKGERIHPSRVSITEERGGAKVMRIDGEVVRDPRSVIRFESPNHGLLKTGGKPIRRSLLVDMALAMYAGNPRALDYFSESEGEPIFDSIEAVDEVLEGWRDARRNNTTGYVPRNLTYHTVDVPADLYTSILKMGEAATIEIANLLNLDSEDFNISTTSRTYFNADQKRKDRINDVLAPYMEAITQRLSMGDVTKRGYVVEFDSSKWLDPDPQTRIAYYEGMTRLRAITPEEIRVREKLPPLSISDSRTPIHAEIVDERRAIAASADDPEWKFADDSTPVTFDGGVDHTFAVDVNRRTITGIVVPYGPRAISSQKSGMRFRFAQGSIRYTDISRIKLLIEHDRNQAVGKATDWRETPRGIEATFKVAEGPEGDRALALAAEGVRDGLSPGVDEMVFDNDPLNRGVQLVKSALAKEVSLVAIPSFDDSRLTSVRASYEGSNMKCDRCGLVHAEGVTDCTPTTPPVTFTAEQFEQFMARLGGQPADEGPEEIDPTGGNSNPVEVNEPLPYRFSYEGGRHVFRSDAEYDFSTDLFNVLQAAEYKRDPGSALDRVNSMIQTAFADVESADVTALNPNRHRADLWQPQQDLPTPLWDMVNSGSTDGTKFDVPKFNSSSGLVGPATEKVEPAPGAYVAELQTITPTQVWGKVEITRQAWRAGGNPQLSGILWDQMLREFYEEREDAVATFLNTLTAATDIALTGTPAATPDNDDDQQTVSELEAAIADLQFERGGRSIRAFAVHRALYRVLARVKTDDGAPMYPIINPSNRNGSAEPRFAYIDIAGVRAVGARSLGTVGTASTNSWLFDPAKVRGWSSAPERLFWDFGATVQTANIPQLSFVTLGIYADVAFANLDINGVRQVTFDPSV